MGHKLWKTLLLFIQWIIENYYFPGKNNFNMFSGIPMAEHIIFCK